MRMLRYHYPVSPAVAERRPQPQIDWSPRADAQETATEYVVRVDAPGLAESDFDIQLDRGVLTVSGERKAPEAEGASYVLRERSAGRFSRRFRFAGKVDADNVSARYEKGVLEVYVPKAETIRKVPVEYETVQ